MTAAPRIETLLARADDDPSMDELEEFLADDGTPVGGVAIVRAIEVSIGRAVGQPEEQPLVALLRYIDPTNATLAARDRIAQEQAP